MNFTVIHRCQRFVLKVLFCTVLLVGLFLFIPMLSTHFRLKGIEVSSKTQAQLEKEIAGLQKKLDDTRKQASSLSREIGIIEGSINLKNAQIRKAQLDIKKKKEELEVLKGDIELLKVRLDRLNDTIGYHENLLAQRIKRQYIERRQSSLELFFGSESFGEFLAKLKYLQRVEVQDRALISRMRSTKGNYKQQQELLKRNQRRVEDMKKSIEKEKAGAEQLRADLEQQKLAKDHLLKVTKNNEKRYQKLIADAKKELEQIQRAINVVIRTGKGVKVKKGEVIGTMGSTGFSTGAHLHFGIYKYNKDDFSSMSTWGWYYSNHVNPLSILESKTVTWDTSCRRDPSGTEKSGKGKWEWPMKKPRITQNYGNNTCYNWMYGGKSHPALDMVGIGDWSIRAIADGEAYFCRNCLRDGGNGVFIFHDDNKMSVYWHLR